MTAVRVIGLHLTDWVSVRRARQRPSNGRNERRKCYARVPTSVFVILNSAAAKVLSSGNF